jgi:hypothetical protein
MIRINASYTKHTYFNLQVHAAVVKINGPCISLRMRSRTDCKESNTKCRMDLDVTLA